MTSAGLSRDRLARLHDAMVSHVERGDLPGLVALVACRGSGHVDVIGASAFGDAQPMPRDAIFRIASLTKPVAAAAAMLLVDDGVLRLDDAVDEWLPELANRRVLRRLDAELDDTVAAVRPITVSDVLTYRLGFGNVMAAPGTYPIQRAEEVLQLATLGPPWPPPRHTPDAWIERFGSLPLMCQPGEQWLYNTGGQVLGVLIERAAGKPLEAFLRDRLFGPLGMNDTGFSVSPRQLDRLTTAYTPDPQSGVLRVLDGVEDSYWSVPPAFPNAAGWLVSTIDDYWAFVQADAQSRCPSGRASHLANVGRVDDDRSADANAARGGAAVPRRERELGARAFDSRGGRGWSCSPRRLRVERRHRNHVAL
jgi:CubicO group peptidase (beta-lactamase class C family)